MKLIMQILKQELIIKIIIYLLIFKTILCILDNGETNQPTHTTPLSSQNDVIAEILVDIVVNNNSDNEKEEESDISDTIPSISVKESNNNSKQPIKQDMQSFEEWKESKLKDKSKSDQATKSDQTTTNNNGELQPVQQTTTTTISLKETRQLKNYASLDCGAKILGKIWWKKKTYFGYT
jgi:hypothetical protein